jgi:uncharacterized membrane protein YedE/YeeE
MLHIFDFAPYHATIGGALLGSASIARMALTGRILGVSGIAGGLVRGHARDPSRWLFVSGLVAAGAGMSQVYPASFGRTELAPWREALGGFAVGLGAALGNGCTSGHGIAGNARLSPRSAFYTATFMATGCLVASASRSASAVRVDHAALPPPSHALTLAGQLLAAHLWAYAVVVMLAPMTPAGLALHLTSLIDGSLFGCGLGLSGMTSPARVAQFLDLSAGEWNPTLVCVMGGALALMTPFMQLAVLSGRLKRPVLPNLSFGLPTATAIDKRLALGGVIFGSGWGIAGMCPGPALATLGSPYGPPLIFLAAMFAGLRAADTVAGLSWLAPGPAPATAKSAAK